MTNQIIKQAQEKFLKDKQDLKDWVEGTVYKEYDSEETVLILHEDIDKYFPDDYISQAITQAVEEALVDLLTDEPENGDWRHLIMQHLDKLNK